MSAREYEEILSSLQDVVRRAYALGKADALKQVIEVMQADDSIRKPLALTGPVEASPSPHGATQTANPTPVTLEPALANDSKPLDEKPVAPAAPKAWWARPPKPVISQNEPGPERRAG